MSGVIGNMTMDDLSKVRRLSRPDAEKFIESFELSEDEREAVMKLASVDLGKGKPTTQHWMVASHDPYRRQWFAVAHILGASLRQLAYMHDIAPQTVLSSLSRILPTEVRASSRLAKQLKLEHLSAYKASYEDNKDYLSTMEPRAAAEWLRDHTELDSLNG